MKLIVGLGNPGKEYATTRHNAGFLLIDSFAKWEKMKWSVNKEWNAEISKGTIRDEEIILCKPLTFMNKSGESVGKLASFYKIRPDDILVLHDEIDLPSGQIQLKKGGGHAGHNGLRDMVAKLGTNTFSRVRIGVGRPATKEEVVEYVLQKFSATEWKGIETKESEIFDLIYGFLSL